jgi:glutathione peroxidase
MSASIHAFTLPALDGGTLNLADYAGQVLLLVNTASECGFTSQYAGLEQLWRTYRERGFAVLGFPCNQFGQQEPGDAAQISRFCSSRYGVTFPMSGKIEVNGADAHPLYRFLTQAAPGMLGTEAIKWNFTKFLVDRHGEVVRRYAPTTAPADLARDIETLLG